MPFPLRVITKRILIIANILAAVFYILSSLSPYIKPTSNWFISLMGLGFPFLLLVLLCFFIFWLFVKRKLALISFFTMLIGIKSIGVVFGFNLPKQFSEKKEEKSIRIVSWNVARFLEWKKNNNEKSRTRLKMLDLIKEQEADILCLQEFFYSPDSVYYHNIREIQAMGYPYFYFSYDPDGWLQYIGSVIFSKYPIIDSGLVRYFRPSMPEALIYTDLKINDDTIRLFTTHLQSVQFRETDYAAISVISKAEDSMFSKSKTVLSKLRKAMRYRSTQADVVRKIMDDSLFPVFFCGDLNDVPNSYTYFRIRGDMKDAFLNKGLGIGRTYASLSPTLRIDYMFYDPGFRIRQFTRVVKPLSDHFLLKADVEIVKAHP